MSGSDAGGEPTVQPGEPLAAPKPPDTPCRDLTSLFFSYSSADTEAAKQLCAGCWYRGPCLEMGLRMPNTKAAGMGVWGGADHIDRTIILRHNSRRRGEVS